MQEKTIKEKITALGEHGYKVIDFLKDGYSDETKVNTLYVFHFTDSEEEIAKLLVSEQEESKTDKDDEQYNYKLKMKNKLQIERYSLYNTTSKSHIIAVEGISFIEGNSITHNLSFEQCEQLYNKARELFEDGTLQFDNAALNKFFNKLKTYTSTKNLTTIKDITSFIKELKGKHQDNYGTIREEIKGYKGKLAPKHIEMIIAEFDNSI